jgi:hypothetical protein
VKGWWGHFSALTMTPPPHASCHAAGVVRVLGPAWGGEVWESISVLVQGMLEGDWVDRIFYFYFHLHGRDGLREPAPHGGHVDAPSR